jgi:hypothetical protein
MKVYKFNTVYTRGQVHCVVADSYGRAEKIFLEMYPGMTIESIEMISEYVAVQEVQEAHDADK